jgi:hypothetical protein
MPVNEYILQRLSDNRESTVGALFKVTVGNPFLQGYTLEDEYRDIKVKGDTRIPAGRYEIIIQEAETKLTLKYRAKYPAWFKKHLMLKSVPNFVGIYIHIGNKGDDTDGCILVGDLVNNNKIGNGEVSSSTACFMRLYSDLFGHLEGKGNQAFITIRDEKHLL